MEAELGRALGLWEHIEEGLVTLAERVLDFFEASIASLYQASLSCCRP